MSKQWTIENDTGAELTVRAPNGFAVELDANSADPRERFDYFAIRQQVRDLEQLRADLAAAVAERDDYRYEFGGLCHTLSVGSEGRPEMKAEDWRKRVDQGIDFLTRPLLSRIEATDKELAKRSSMLDICTQNCSDWIGMWRAEQERAEQADQRLGNLLAVIHRDGGHYESEHGTEKACADAETAVHVMRGCVDGFISSANEWRQRAEQAEARLAAIDAQPTVVTVGHGDYLHRHTANVPIGTELIARPAKDQT